MAYTELTNKVTGNGVTATDLNLIGANHAAGVPDALTAKGAMLVGTGANTAAQVTIGANDAVLWADSTATAGVAWAIPGRVAAYPAGSAGYMTRNAWTHAAWLTGETFDTASAYASAVFTAPHSGYYFVAVAISFTLSDTGDATTAPHYAQVGISKDGTFYCAVGSLVLLELPAATGLTLQVSGMDVVYLSRGTAVRPVYYLKTDYTNVLYSTTAALGYFHIAPIL